MPMPFDATLKDLIRAHPIDWLKQLGVPIEEPLEVLSAELSTVSAAADTLIRVGKRITHIDLESGPDDFLARRMLLYNVLAYHHTGLPVHTIVVLLRPNAQRASLTNRLEYNGLSFQFDIVKMWEIPSNELLKVGVGLLPLAVLGKPPEGMTRKQALPEQVEVIAERVHREARGEFGKLMTATYVLSSMHVEPVVAREVINRVLNMKELPGYQFILREGAIEQAQTTILNQGRIRLDEPTERQANRLKAIEDLDRLNRMSLKVLSAKSWDALLRVR